MWGTGLGAALSADNQAPQAGDLPTAVDIYVGGVRAANKLYSGRSPCCAGVDQIVFQIPDNAPQGCYVPVQAVTGGVPSNAATIAIAAGGGACSDGEGPLRSLNSGGLTATLALSKVHFQPDPLADLGDDTRLDFSNALFLDTPSGPWTYNRLYALPPPGACAVHGFSGNVLRPGELARYLNPSQDLMPAASVASSTTSLALGAARTAASALGSFVGVALAGEQEFPLFFQSGSTFEVTTQSPGFSGQATIPEGLRWSNRADAATVPRDQPLTVRWSGSSRNRVYVVGVSANEPRGGSGIFVCAADAAAGELTVPAYVLGSLPASSQVYGQSFGALFVGEIFPQGAVAAPGVAAGSLISIAADSREVDFQ